MLHGETARGNRCFGNCERSIRLHFSEISVGNMYKCTATFIKSPEGVQKYYVAHASSSPSACATERYDKSDALTFLHQNYDKIRSIIPNVTMSSIKIKCLEIKLRRDQYISRKKWIPHLKFC